MSSHRLSHTGSQPSTSTEDVAVSVLPIMADGISLTRDGRRILSSVDLAISQSSGLTVLLGPNGAGKSLLMRIVAGLLRPDNGIVTWAGLAPDNRRIRRIGFLFQRPVLLRRSAFANIDYAIAVMQPKLSHAARHEAAEAALVSAGLAPLRDVAAHALSGGEQQRLALARALACKPELLILDEPAANLDPASTAAIEAQLKMVQAQGVPIVLITHDLAQARRLADRVMFMHAGEVRELTDAATFFAAPQSRAAAAFVKGEIVI